MKKASSQRKNEFDEKKIYFEQIVKQREMMNKNINNCDEEVKSYKNELLKIKNKLFMHYHQLLRDGKDNR